MRWLRKVILRAAGIIKLHDDNAVFRNQAANLRLAQVTADYAVDPAAVVTSCKAVLLEGLEVAFMVLAVSAGGPGLLSAALFGAAAAAILVVLATLAVRRPLARIPENTLKFAVGIAIAAFGIYSTGEGMGLPWPGQDLSLPAIRRLPAGRRTARRLGARCRAGADARPGRHRLRAAA